MELVYASETLKSQCTNIKAAHKLKNKGKKNLEGYFAIDVKSRRDQWRIILQPLDENEKPYVPCNIDQIAGKVSVVEISEVSKHYE